MKKLRLYRIIRYNGTPVSVLVVAYGREKALEYSDKTYGPTIHSEIKNIQIKDGLVLTETERR